jgi:hypothetical protein
MVHMQFVWWGLHQSISGMAGIGIRANESCHVHYYTVGMDGLLLDSIQIF